MKRCRGEAGCASGSDEPDRPGGRRPAAARAGLLASLAHLPVAAFTFAVVTDRGALASTGLPEGWQHVSHAAGVVLGCLCLCALGLSRRSALVAAAVGVPAMYAVLVVTGHLLADFRIDESARLTDNPLVWAASGLPTTGLLLAVATCQRRQVRPPSELVSALLVLISVGTTTVVLMPQLLPSRRDAQGGGPFPRGGFDVEAWGPLLAAPLVLSVLWVTTSYLRSERRSRRAVGPPPLP